MRMRAAALAMGFVLQTAPALAQEQRPPLAGVTSIRIANYNTPSTVITERERVSGVVRELAQLRGKPWRRADTKLSCYATLVLLNGTKTLTLFRVSPEAIVERAPGKSQASYSIAVEQADVPRIRSILAGIPPAKDCN